MYLKIVVCMGTSGKMSTSKTAKDNIVNKLLFTIKEVSIKRQNTFHKNQLATFGKVTLERYCMKEKAIDMVIVHDKNIYS